MFLLSEQEFDELLMSETVGIKWDVFSRFLDKPEETEELENELRRARTYYRELSDEKLYKERSDVAKTITTVLRFISDFDGAVYVIGAPFTLGLSLISYLINRLINLALIDSIEAKAVKKQAMQAINSLQAIKKTHPKQSKEIDETIRRIERRLDEM